MALHNKLLFSFCLVTLFAKSASCNGMEVFVALKLDEFPQWMKENTLDPSPLISGPTMLRAGNMFVTNLLGSLSDHGVQGHSEGIQVESVTANLQSAEIVTSFTLQGSIKFSGRYLASGTLVPSESALSGEGSWYIQVPFIHFQNVTMSWVFTSQGYISITKFKITEVRLPQKGMDVYFENLWEDDPTAITYQPVIKDALYLAFQDSLRLSNEHSIKQIITQYFQQMFADTPLTEIIALTRPPPTTTTAETKTSSSSTNESLSSTTAISAESDDDYDDRKWQMSRAMAVLLVLWVISIVVIGVMVVFIVKMFITQSRLTKNMNASISALPQGIHVDYISDSRMTQKQLN